MNVLGALDKSRQLVVLIAEQHSHMKLIPEQCRELESRIEELKEAYNDLEQRNTKKMTPVAGRQVKAMLEDMENHLEITPKILEPIANRKSKVLSKTRWFLNAKKISEKLDKVISDLDKLQVRYLLVHVLVAVGK